MEVLDRLESRKLKGLLLLFGFLLLVLVIYLIADAVWGVSDLLFSTVAGSGTSGAAAHQAAQGAADWQQAKSGSYRTTSAPEHGAPVVQAVVDAATAGSASSVGPPVRIP